MSPFAVDLSLDLTLKIRLTSVVSDEFRKIPADLFG